MFDFINILAVFGFDDAIYVIMLALAAASTAASADASKDAAKAQEQQGLLAQDAAKKAARNEELQVAENIKRARNNKRRRLARIRKGMLTSGLVFEGSLEDSFTETAGRMELEIQDAARAGAMNAQNIRAQGDLSLWEGRVAAVSSRMEATGTLLQGATSMAGTAYKYGAPTTNA